MKRISYGITDNFICIEELKMKSFGNFAYLKSIEIWIKKLTQIFGYHHGTVNIHRSEIGENRMRSSVPRLNALCISTQFLRIAIPHPQPQLFHPSMINFSEGNHNLSCRCTSFR